MNNAPPVDRPLPQNLFAERALLGAILVVGVAEVPALAPFTAALRSLPESIVTFLNSL